MSGNSNSDASTSATEPSAKGSELIRLNVGGTKYTVSRALIDQHPTTMLARLISDTWQKDPEQEIFIDRDGETFRHVLSYMRDLKVNIPLTLTKATLLHEFEYYGFENVAKDAIDGTCAGIEAATVMITHRENHKARVKELIALHHYEILAYAIFCRYSASGDLEMELDKLGDEDYRHAPDIEEWDHKMFRQCLMEYGFKVKSGYTHVHVCDTQHYQVSRIEVSLEIAKDDKNSGNS